MTTDFTKFNIHSDFDTDEVIMARQIDLTQSSSGYWTGSISHSFGFKPLAFAMIELNHNGLWLSASNTTATDALGLVVVSYNNRVEVHLTTPLGTTVNYTRARVFALLPSDQPNANITAPSSFGNFNRNSDYLYDKLVAQGIATLSNQSGGAQTIYTHNLGYLPRVMLWQEEVGSDNLHPVDPSFSRQASTGLPLNVEVHAIQLTDTALSMWYYSDTTLPNLKIHYRIYGSRLVQEGV